MNVYVVWEVDHLSGLLAQALSQNDRAAIATLSQDLQRAAGILKAWAMASGGAALVDFAAMGVLEVSAERMNQLPNIRRQFESACSGTLAIGVGMEISEAYVAIQVAQRRGGDQIALYVPEMETELAEQHLGKADDQSSGSPQPQPPPGQPEQSKPEPQKSAPTQTAPEPSPKDGAATTPPGDDKGGEQEQASGDPKAAIAQALQELKANAQAIEQLKGTNPQAFQAVMDTVQAMIMMAQGMVDAPEDAKKSEESVEESSSEEESSSSEEALEKQKLPMPTATPKREHHVYPVGSVKEGKIKIQHTDKVTGQPGGANWNEVRSGQVMSEDGHAVSSRNQSGK